MKEIVEDDRPPAARASSAVNQQSGVSVRMSIANYETMVSSAERRGLLLSENPAVPRISDLVLLTASTRGKIELNLTEDEGQEDRLIAQLVGEAIKSIFEAHVDPKHFRPLVEWFAAGNRLLIGDRLALAHYQNKLAEVPGLKTEIDQFLEKWEPELAPEAGAALAASALEFILEGLYVGNRLNKEREKRRKSTYAPQGDNDRACSALQAPVVPSCPPAVHFDPWTESFLFLGFVLGGFGSGTLGSGAASETNHIV